ncbi:MAG: VWA domain-containing protein [Ardenticatenaceae bacterium]|nr:VWA domain-containing protein [Anaerolineales bacterium]MCB8921189.1 VWA domain-containing protein [Ardenticatenaceae bacterium]MCB9004261.1 VWA domain-containing protein [Ardenticatenaceae bacterium]
MNKKRLMKQMTWLMVLLLLLAACGGAGNEAAQENTSSAVEETTTESLGSPAAVGSEREGSAPLATPATGEKVVDDRVEVDSYTTVEEEAAEEIVTELAAEPLVDEDGGVRAGDTAVSETAPSAALDVSQNSSLNAGEVDDNAQWDDYLLYLREYQGAAIIPVDISERHQIVVQDSQGNPVLGAIITIQADGRDVETLRTHSDGRANFYPRALNLSAAQYDVTVTVAGQAQSFVIPAGGSQREWIITHSAADQLPVQARLDVLFLIDATGSMSDEINQLKENIRAISAQIDALPSQPDVRFGMVAYRDQGDAFVTQVTDFTPDVTAFAADLANLFAEGGGDYPEDLNEGLAQAIHTPEWRVDGTVSLIFLVADAPPHLDYGQQNHYAAEMAVAAERGIKIYPIASSGLDSQGEYIFRQLAQFTGGRFIFLTYGASGPGSTGTETTFDVSDYTVSALDTLVVRIVEEELAYLAR